MRFQYTVDIRSQVPDDRPGQQHTAGFSPDHACPHHMIPNPKIIFRSEMLFYQNPEPFIPGHHDIAHPAALVFQRNAIFMQDF